MFTFIDTNADLETMACVAIEDIAAGTGIDTKKLRGVVSSLVKKNKIEIEEWDSNDQKTTFFWVKG